MTDRSGLDVTLEFSGGAELMVKDGIKSHKVTLPAFGGGGSCSSDETSTNGGGGSGKAGDADETGTAAVPGAWTMAALLQWVADNLVEGKSVHVLQLVFSVCNAPLLSHLQYAAQPMQCRPKNIPSRRLLSSFLIRCAIQSCSRRLYRKDQLVLDGTVRPGVLVLVNDADWELMVSC
jgi:hypothetical protein